VYFLLVFATLAVRAVWAASTLYHFSLRRNFQIIGWACTALAVFLAYVAGRLNPY
jgi:hypothetical protein